MWLQGAGIVDAVNSLLRDLMSNKWNGYGLRKIPCDADADMRRAIHQLGRLENDELERLLETMEDRHGWFFNGFAERMASLAVRTGDKQYIQEGLLALA